MGLDAMGWFRTETPLTNEQVDALNERFWECHFPWELCVDEGHKFFVGKQSYTDFPDTVREIDFNLQRYYGVGYERGRILCQVTVMEWLRNQLPGVEIHFGSDSTDMEHLSEWTEEDSIEVLKHFFKVGHEPYGKPFKARGLT